MDNERIHVLAVMQKSANVARLNAQAHTESRLLRAHAEDAEAARAAVAELIEAAKLARSYMGHVEWCSEIPNGIDGDCDCGHELHRERVNAAIARVQGSAP